MTTPLTPIALVLAVGLTAAAPPASAHDEPVGAADVAADDETTPALPDDPWQLVDVPIPDDVVLEVGGLRPVGDDVLYVCTRRGDLWRLDDAYGDAPRWSLWAEGLAEPLGIRPHADGDGLDVIQRGELSWLRDTDGDGRADRYDVLSDVWRISGNYHEYAFGPARDGQGRTWITLNRPFGDEPFGRVAWRGWALRLDGDRFVAAAGGLRSPAGVVTSPWGEVFYTDNQGEWCGASKLSLLSDGGFHGHPWGQDDATLPESIVAPVGELPDGALMPLAARQVPGFVLPCVWFPYDVMGRSPSGFAWDTTGGAFGPFEGQVFVGDQYQASVLRVALERVDGTWQGACFPFRKGLASGVIRVAFAPDGSLVAGCSDRGWPSLGERGFGLQRLVWDGTVPTEMHHVSARPDGFEVVFTRPVLPATAADPTSWELSRFTYRLHSDYGSDETDTWPLDVTAVEVSDDGLTVRLTVDGLREGYVHALHAAGVRDRLGRELRHDRAWYTLIDRPGDAPAPRAVVACDDDTADAAARLATALGDDGCEVLVVRPHDDPRAFDALRDAELLVLLTGDARLHEQGRRPLLRYLDGGHALVAAGAGLAPLVRTSTDPLVAEDGAWAARRLAGEGVEPRDEAGTIEVQVTEAGASHALLGILPAPSHAAPGPLAPAAREGLSEADGEVLLQGDDDEPLVWTLHGARQRTVGLALDPTDPGSHELLVVAARWARTADRIR